MQLPIYGYMPTEWQVESHLGRPARFANADGTPANDEQWMQWLERMADDLSSFLWPRFIHGAWHGAAEATMEALTRADLKLMGPMFDSLDQSPSGVALKHDALFVIEDLGRPSVAGFLHYAPAAPTTLIESFDRLLMVGGRDIAYPATLNLKRRMQRPRPYQSAAILDLTQKFRHRAATSATSPAMVSGHCLQGAMAMVNVVIEWEAISGAPTDAKLLGSVQQYFIDTGDRRVFAGVHYPTDNLSSWYAALRLCCHVFDTDDKKARARQVLWDAISHKSAVYMAIEQAVSHDAASPLAGPLKRLKQAADAPCLPPFP